MAKEGQMCETEENSLSSCSEFQNEFPPMPLLLGQVPFSSLKAPQRIGNTFFLFVQAYHPAQACEERGRAAGAGGLARRGHVSVRMAQFELVPSHMSRQNHPFGIFRRVRLVLLLIGDRLGVLPHNKQKYCKTHISLNFEDSRPKKKRRRARAAHRVVFLVQVLVFGRVVQALEMRRRLCAALPVAEG